MKYNPKAGRKEINQHKSYKSEIKRKKESWREEKLNYLQQNNERITSNKVTSARDLGVKIGDDIQKWTVISSC